MYFPDSNQCRPGEKRGRPPDSRPPPEPLLATAEFAVGYLALPFKVVHTGLKSPGRFREKGRLQAEFGKKRFFQESPGMLPLSEVNTTGGGNRFMITAFARTVILYFLIMFGLRIMGKRQIGELEPSELVLTMMISDLATVPMQDFGIPLLAGVIPILTLLALSMLLSHLSLRSLRFREVMCGTPAILIRNGKIQQSVMGENRFTVDELLEELRSQGISRVEDVKYAVLENSGQLSVLPWTREQPPTAAQMNLEVEDDVTLPVVLINDGRVLRKNLKACGKDAAWLQKELENRRLTAPAEVFLLTLDERGEVACVEKEVPT